MCAFILARRPHVVFLQEVIDPSWRLIIAKLDHSYNGYPGYVIPPAGKYYNVILILKDCVSVTSDLRVYPFLGSQKGRHLLQLSVRFFEVDFDVINSHLESKLQGREQRIRQVNEVFGIMSELDRSNKISIFGGDLNLREAEVRMDDLPEDGVDVWEACGKPRDHQFTWDLTENDNLEQTLPSRQPLPRFRFDRVYLNPDDGALQPKSFELVGKERLPGCGRFPSDHWGLWIEFQVRK